MKENAGRHPTFTKERHQEASREKEGETPHFLSWRTSIAMIQTVLWSFTSKMVLMGRVEGCQTRKAFRYSTFAD